MDKVELYRALRGAGAVIFGVVTRIDLQTAKDSRSPADDGSSELSPSTVSTKFFSFTTNGS